MEVLVREHLNDQHKLIYDRHLEIAMRSGCDVKQAEGIARERTLAILMAASAAISNARMAREQNKPLP